MTFTDLATAAIVALGALLMAALAVVPLLLQREAERADAPAPVVPLRPARPTATRSTRLHAA